MDAKKILGWIGCGLLGAAGAILGQVMSNASVKSDVEDYIEEHKDELLNGNDDNEDNE